MGLEIIDELGAIVEKRWSDIGRDPRHFSDVATKALTEGSLAGRLTSGQIIDWALSSNALPRQQNLPATFGQPPITLYRSRDFYIEGLFWVDGSTIIHQHAFSGAFLVLEGSSIETTYEFELVRAVDEHFRLGQVRIATAALLRTGSIRSITSGPDGLVHSLFHLERPSVTIVVRTFKDAGAGPQFNYARPGVAYDPFLEDEVLQRALQFAKLMRQVGDEGFEKRVGDFVESADLHRSYRVLKEALWQSDRALFERLLERVRDRTVIDVFRASFEEAKRLGFLMSRRSFIKEPDLRFFLGVLLNAHRRQDVLSLVLSRTADREPAAQVASLVRQLSLTNIKLQAAGTPWQPNVLGLPEMNDPLEKALATELAGRAPSGDEAEARFLSTLRELPALAGLFG